MRRSKAKRVAFEDGSLRNLYLRNILSILILFH
jgi:hypothetical protein